MGKLSPENFKFKATGKNKMHTVRGKAGSGLVCRRTKELAKESGKNYFCPTK